MSERICGADQAACFFVPVLFVAVGIAVRCCSCRCARRAGQQPGLAVRHEFIPTLRVGAWSSSGMVTWPFRIAGARKRCGRPDPRPGARQRLIALFLLSVPSPSRRDRRRRRFSRASRRSRGSTHRLVATATIVLPVIWRSGRRRPHRAPYMSFSVGSRRRAADLERGREAAEPRGRRDRPRSAMRARPGQPAAGRRRAGVQVPAALLTTQGAIALDADEFLRERGERRRAAHELCTETGRRLRSCTDRVGRRPRAGQDPGSVLVLDVNPAPRARRVPRPVHGAADLLPRRRRRPGRPDPPGLLDPLPLQRLAQVRRPHLPLGPVVQGPDLFDHEGDWEGITVSLTDRGRSRSCTSGTPGATARVDDLRALGVTTARGRAFGSRAAATRRIRRRAAPSAAASRAPTSPTHRDGGRSGRQRDDACRAPTACGRCRSAGRTDRQLERLRRPLGPALHRRHALHPLAGPETPPFQALRRPGRQGRAQDLRQWYKRQVDRLPPPDGA